MKKVCFVNNYNYAQYLTFCLDSLLGQSIKFDIIYVVDDGSTDGSRAIIAEYVKSFHEIVPLFKENAGQLSCFNYVSDYITEDDLVWCLDSDDYYPPDYVERFLIETKDIKSDFFFCKPTKFLKNEEAPKTSYLESEIIVNIDLSVQITRLTKCWIGGPTSGLVISGKLFKDILPYPFDNHWVTRADDVLIYASSLGGYSKTYIPSLCFGYRFHGANNFWGRDLNKPGYHNSRTKNLATLFSWYENKYGLGEKFELGSILEEYNSITSKRLPEFINLTKHRLVKKYFIRKICSLPKRLFKK